MAHSPRFLEIVERARAGVQETQPSEIMARIAMGEPFHLVDVREESEFSAGHIKGGRIKALMVAGAQRNPAFPDVPCAAELGLPEYNVTTWYGIWAPKGTPADIQARATDKIRKACTTDEAKAVWAGQGADFPNLAGPQFAAFINAEIKKWAKVVKASGARLD